MPQVLPAVAGAVASFGLGEIFGGGEEAPTYGQAVGAAEDPSVAALRKLLMENITAGLSEGGISPEVERLMFGRAQERMEDPHRENLERIASYMQSQGMAGSTPAVESMHRAERGHQQGLQDISRDIAIENALRRREFLNKALTMFGVGKGDPAAAFQSAYKPWDRRQTAIGNVAGKIGTGFKDWAGSWGGSGGGGSNNYGGSGSWGTAGNPFDWGGV